MDSDNILSRLYALLPELEAEGNYELAQSMREVIGLVENERLPEAAAIARIEDVALPAA